MLRVVGMGKTGLFIVLRDSAITELAGRTFWPTPADVWAAIAREKMNACEHILHT